MKKTTLLVILFTALNWTAHSNAADSSEKKLVWSDEFDGKDLDYTKWGIEVNAFGGGNNEMQIYTDRAKNIRVENGNLIIEAHKDNAAIAGTSRPFSSGRIRTRKRGDWKYGRIDVRAKLPV
ncbi:MAG: glycoside hydrolase family 16 protein, partial [Opitutae bacterium]|nr:glycoside hydrolase family 16 protein [Opitutae bacterium]